MSPVLYYKIIQQARQIGRAAYLEVFKLDILLSDRLHFGIRPVLSSITIQRQLVEQTLF